jgi:hypothetical protein
VAAVMTEMKEEVVMGKMLLIKEIKVYQAFVIEA